MAVRYLEACLDSSFSFLDVVDVTPGIQFSVQDALTGWRGVVTEKAASQTVQRWDILFAKVVRLDDMAVLDGCAPIAFPPLEKGPIIELRNKILKANPAITAEVVRDYRLEILDIYHSTAERLLNPELPAHANTVFWRSRIWRISFLARSVVDSNLP